MPSVRASVPTAWVRGEGAARALEPGPGTELFTGRGQAPGRTGLPLMVASQAWSAEPSALPRAAGNAPCSESSWAHGGPEGSPSWVVSSLGCMEKAACLIPALFGEGSAVRASGCQVVLTGP